MTRIANIGPRGQQRRMRLGYIAFGVAAALAIALVALDPPQTARLTVFLPLWMAGLGIFQARDKT